MKILTRAGRLCSDHVCRLFFFLATLLFCESSHVLAQITAIWTGSGGDSNYNTAANWDIAQVPINNLIDDFIVVIPASHTVNFNVPGTGHKVFQLSLADNATLNINSGRDLAVVDEASVAGILTTDNGVFSAPSLASRFDGTRGRIEITGGGDITLNATSYSSLGLNGTATLFSADGTGTVLNLSSVQSINAGWDDFSGGSQVNTIRVTNNAAINLSGVETINAPSRGEDRIDFVVGANSTINLSGLTTTTSASGGDTRFDVQAANFSLPALLNASNTQFDVAAGSTLDLPMLVTHNLGTYQIRAASVVTANDLTSLNNVDLTIDPDGTFNAEDLTDFQGSSVTLSPSRTFNTGVLSNIDNAQFFVEGGLEYGTAQGEVSATSYSSLGLNGTATLFSADGTGTVLNLSSVQSINAGWDDFSGGSRVNTIRATNNAAINLSGVETINAPSRGEDRIDFVVGANSMINLSGLTTTTSASGGDTRFDVQAANFSLPALLNASNTQFDVAAGSTLDLPMLVTHNLGTYQIRAASVVTANDLTSLNNVDLTIDPDGTFNAEDLTDFQGSSVTLSPSRTFNTGVLSNIDNAQFFVEGGLEYGTAQGEVSATSYSSLGLNGTATLFSADGTGTVLNLSSVQSINAGWDDFSGGSQVNTIRVTNNAAINLSGVETINAPSRGEDRIDFVVGANSTINLSGLTTTTSASGGDTRFDVQAANFSLPALLNASNTQFDVAAGSTLDLPMLVTHNLGTYQIRAASVVTANDLTSLNNVDLTIDPDGTFNAEDLTDFQGSSVTLSPSRTFNTGVLSNIDNAQFFVEGGLEYGTAQGEVSATSYSSLGLNGTATLFSADGTGTVLNLSSVQSINAGWDDFSGGSRVNTIRATNNAAINLSGVETINAPSRGEDRIDFVVETGGSIDLESLHLITNASSGQTRFTISGAGSIKIGDLNAADNATFTVNDLNSKLDVDGSFNVDSGSVTVGAGASIEVSKSYSFGMTTESILNLDSGVLRFDGIGGQQMEVGGEDVGVGGFMSGNFGMGQLRIGTTTQRTSVDLLDVIDNGNRGGGGEAEALYLFGLGGPAGLRILNNSALVLNGINVYAWDPVAGSQVHLNSLFNPGELRIPYDDGFLQLAPLDFQWDNNAGGDFNLGGNWSDGLVPLGSDSAIWNLGSVAGYTVQFGTNVATDSAIIKSDTVNFDLGGFQYSIAALNATTGLVIGQDTIDNAKLTISNGTLHSKDVRIAAAAGSQGILTIGPSGSLQVDSDVVLGVGSGTLRVIPANQVNVGGNVIMSGDSRLEGGGLIATLVENQTGTLAPGVSAGIMSLNANYTQQSTGKLEIEIGGVDNSNANAPQFDQLIVSGSANLAGGLAVSLIDAGAGLFVPNDGDFFEIVSASAELATSFTNLTLPALVDDSWLMGQFGNSLFLRVAENLADFDGDLDVDGRDFTLWQRGFGITSGATKANGDSNGDGAVDAADLDNWKIQYGYQIVGGGSPFSSTVAVPEPAGLSFLLLGMLGLTGSARFWRQ